MKRFKEVINEQLNQTKESDKLADFIIENNIEFPQVLVALSQVLNGNPEFEENRITKEFNDAIDRCALASERWQKEWDKIGSSGGPGSKK